MPKYYSKTTGGFYDSIINATMPGDAVAVTDNAYATLFAAQSNGQMIQADVNGNPIAVAPPAPTPAQIGQAAYAASIADGCDIVALSTPELNGAYPLDDSSNLKIVGEQNYIALKGTFTNGQTTRNWMDVLGVPHIFPNTAEFTAFGEAIAVYIDALQTALAEALAGGTWTAPAQPVTIP